MNSKKIKNLMQNLALFLLLAAASGATFLILFDLNFAGKIYPRVSAAGLSIGYFEPKLAQQFIESKIGSWKDQKMQFYYQESGNPDADKKWQIEIGEMGIVPGASKTILTAYNSGRTGNPLDAIAEKVKIIIGGKNIPLYYDLDENKFNSYLNNNFSFLEKPPKDASLVLSDGKIAEIPSQKGYTIDRDTLKNRTIAEVQTLGSQTVPVDIKASSPEITDEKVQQAKKFANSLLEDKISLRFEDKSWELDKNLIESTIQFGPSEKQGGTTELAIKINKDPIYDFLEKIQLDTNRMPSNAVFGIKDNKLIVESGGKTGVGLSLDESAKKIAEDMILAAENAQKNTDINLIVGETEPEISLASVEKMGITTLLGQGKSNFAGSPKNRAHNIRVGAAKFNNIFIAPGEEFSFVKTLGEITVKAGYLAELVIKDKSVVAELGGGLCQVSTTAFRAAIYSGLPILERRPHAYAVPYYKPHGMDSTIYPPHPDLRFKNDTGGIILIQTKIEKNDLTFNFFGVKQNRTIKVIGPTTYSSQPDGSMKTVFWREFYEEGKLTKKEPFYSSYASPNNYPHKNPLE